MRFRTLPLGSACLLLGVLLSVPGSAQNPEDSALAPKTGKAIQGDTPLAATTKRGHCNPASTRCQLPHYPVQPKDSDLNGRTESGRRLTPESSLNDESRTGPVIAVPPAK